MAPITLLVMVQSDGHVSDSRIELGSGAPVADEALQHCVLARSSFTPRIVDSRPVPSWQRVYWPSRPNDR